MHKSIFRPSKKWEIVIKIQVLLGCYTVQAGSFLLTNRLSQNVSNQLPNYTTMSHSGEDLNDIMEDV
jgi:hypothetical protein